MRKKVLSLLLVAIMLFAAVGCEFIAPHADFTAFVSGEMNIYFIDVGQADCELIVLDGHAMLIDGGNVADGNDVVGFIRDLGIETLDAIVATHPHEDHIGGLSKVIKAFEVKKIYSPVDEYSGECFRIFSEAAEKECGITVCRANDYWTLGDAHVRVLWPFDTKGLDANNLSAVLKVTFGNASFLFMGDLEKECETKLVNSGADLTANVIKVGHHGSSSSSGYLFLRSVMPQFGVISCGKNNDYGHPHRETLEIYGQANIELLRTDELGTVMISTDGRNLSVAYGDTLVTAEAENATPALETPAADADAAIIANKKSKKYHTRECENLPAEGNRVYFDSASEAEQYGYEPCGACIK